MQIFQVLLSAFVWTGVVSAVVVDRAMVTPAPIASIAPKHEALRRHRIALEWKQSLQERQLDNLGFCYPGGEEETGVCDPSIQLFKLCEQYFDDPDPAPYWQCLCENGAVAATQACNWCQAAFNISYDQTEDQMDSSQCALNSATIAPIPASYLALVSSFNASYTGTIPGVTNTGAGSGASQTGSASDGTYTSSKKGNSTSSLISTSTQIFFGGGGAVPSSTTTNTGAQSLTTNTGSKTGAAQGWRISNAVLLSVVMLGVTTLCLG